MTMLELAQATRSFRRFNEAEPVPYEKLVEWVDAARVTASARNLQPLKYRIVGVEDSEEECEALFATTKWAGYLTDWDGPAKGERPTGYIVVCCDKNLTEPEPTHFDVGIASQTIMLAAAEAGFGGCMILAFAKKTAHECLALPDHIEPMLVLALGKPVEEVHLVDIVDGDFKYYRDDQQVHYVPKRPLEEVIIGSCMGFEGDEDCEE